MTQAIVGLIDQIKRCEGAGATTAALAMAFICIDTMAFLGLPEGKERLERVLSTFPFNHSQYVGKKRRALRLN